MARALERALDPGLLRVIVNVGDDTERYGVHVSADPDTVLYTLAGVVGPHGWGRSDDSSTVMDELAGFGVDTTFRLGDRDLALCLARTSLLAGGATLSEVIRRLADALGVRDTVVMPATDDPLRTVVGTATGEWLEFQEYFVDRGHADEVAAVAYHGSVDARPAPGVVEAIDRADTVVIAPSNPPLSIWPILAVDAIGDAVRRHPRTVAVSPLFSGRPRKGPADRVMRGLGLSHGTRGVLEAYDGLLGALVVDRSDADDVAIGRELGVEILSTDTRLDGDDRGAACVRTVLTWGRP